MKKINRKSVISFIVTAVLCVSAFFLIAPYLQGLILPFQKLFDRTDGYGYINNLSDNAQVNIDKSALKPPPQDNTLVIPKIGVDAKIIESFDESALNIGIWRKPESSTPPSGGNTVLTAHRFQYLSGPNTFYSLDKMEVGDKFFVYWDHKEYDYEVISTKIVSPTEVVIEDNTKEEIITLYTCTYNAETRVVVVAKRILLNTNP
jgi:LPXTG-site transpeptidase (sortase) family protein